jgi:hypothetical protein
MIASLQAAARTLGLQLIHTHADFCRGPDRE